MREGTTLRVTAANRVYGEFYDFYSASPENFGYHLVNPDTSVVVENSLKSGIPLLRPLSVSLHQLLKYVLIPCPLLHQQPWQELQRLQKTQNGDLDATDPAAEGEVQTKYSSH